MHFDLTDEQKMLQASLHALLQDRVDLHALTRATLKDVSGLRVKLDADIAALGVTATLCPVTHGGLDLGILTLVAVSEELGRHAAPSNSVQNAVAAWLIAQAGDDIQRDRWLPGLIDGHINAAIAKSASLEVSGDVLSGEASNVEHADTADVFIVATKDKLALIERGDAVAVSMPSPLDISRPVSSVTFSAAPASLLSTSTELHERLSQAQIILLAADAYGAGQRAHEMAVAYAMERRQFDRPIGAFQALKHQLADAALTMAPARFLPWRAAYAWDTSHGEAARLAALAKAHTPDVAVSTARAMVEAHGGVGYTWEYPLHLFLKRAMYDRVAWGGPAFHRAAAARLADW